MKKECKKCGAMYEIIEHNYPMRDEDSLKCDFCNITIHSWNGGGICSSKIISKPSNSEGKKINE